MEPTITTQPADHRNTAHLGNFTSAHLGKFESALTQDAEAAAVGELKRLDRLRAGSDCLFGRLPTKVRQSTP
jgi:hypothetical protein